MFLGSWEIARNLHYVARCDMKNKLFCILVFVKKILQSFCKPLPDIKKPPGQGHIKRGLNPEDEPCISKSE